MKKSVPRKMKSYCRWTWKKSNVWIRNIAPDLVVMLSSEVYSSKNTAFIKTWYTGSETYRRCFLLHPDTIETKLFYKTYHNFHIREYVVLNVSFNEGQKTSCHQAFTTPGSMDPTRGSLPVYLSTFVACFAPAYVRDDEDKWRLSNTFHITLWYISVWCVWILTRWKN